MKGLIVTTFIFVGIGLLSGIVSAVLFCLGMDTYAAIGMISTIISILLGIISMVYSYVSGNETSALFKKFGEKIEGLDQQINKIEEQSTKLEKQIKTIEEQNRSLVEKIKVELSKENYDQANIDNIRKNNASPQKRQG